MSALLEIKDLHAYYGKSHVLHGVNLHVGKGEIVSLLGRNGVGRSTMVKAVMGQVDVTGSIEFNGASVVGLPAFKIAHLGLGYVLGMKKGKQSRWSLADMYTMFPRLQERQHVQAGVLSGGEQQMLTLCRTLMGDPDLIMIDEPTEGLAPKIVDLVAEYLKALKERGISILLVEQKLAIALEISQRVYVMGHGMIVFEGTPDALRANQAIRKEWLEV
jgi:branched-chain amino acid transport system ATP-binding protein